MNGNEMPLDAPELARRIEFYQQNYTLLDLSWCFNQEKKVVLEQDEDKFCRFCERRAPEASFRLQAHAIPRSLGNRKLFTTYECDECNKQFGDTIENDLGNWSKPYRTLARISGDRGVPTLKKVGSGAGWRIEFKKNTLLISHFEEDPPFVIDMERKRIVFELERDPYTPIAVLKAFIRIGLTIMPSCELNNFTELLQWIREPDHTKRFIERLPVITSFMPGPMPKSLIVSMLLWRKADVTELPYCFLIFSYGNYVFQVWIPSLKQDSGLAGKELDLPALPTPNSSDSRLYGKARIRSENLCGREKIKGDKFSIELGFSHIELNERAS